MLLSTLILELLAPAAAITMYPSNISSIKEAMDLVIQGTLAYCPWVHNVSGAAPGMFQAPYYWWEAGVAWAALIDWQAYTGNMTYDHWIRQALVLQSGKNWNYMTENQTSVEGNDDQAFWGIAAMNAAEKNLTRAPGNYPPWLYFAQATFNTMAGRWDNSNCNGGLRWQIYTWNSGYDYKNMVSNGCLFHLAARLTRFTNNESYIIWAERVWDWAVQVGFLNVSNRNATDASKKSMQVLDGAHIESNCTDLSAAEWTYDQGLMISGCAYLYNYTGDQKWLDRVEMLWNRASGALFYNDNSTILPGNYILYEPSCMTRDESIVRCSNDQRCFKGILLSFMGYSMQVVPQLKDKFWPYVVTSAQAASWSCSGGTDGHTCGLSWLHQGWDGWYGLGEQLCALSSFNTLLYDNFKGPFTAADLPEVYTVTTNASVGSGNGSTTQGGGAVYGWGGTAGLNHTSVEASDLDITGGDKAGAGVLTAFVIIFIVTGSVWIIL